MKTGSDNFRQSAIQDVVKHLRETDTRVIIYEPTLDAKSYLDCEVTQDLTHFKQLCDIVVSNRWNNELEDIRQKVFTRDLFMRD